MTYHPTHSTYPVVSPEARAEYELRRAKSEAFATQNNWLIPVEGDGSHPDSASNFEWLIRQQGQQVLIDIEPPVHFNQMVSEWLPAYFRDMPWRDVQIMARDLQVDVPAPRGRAQYVIALVWYFRSRWS